MEDRLAQSWITFKLQGGNYCLDSARVATIVIPTLITPLPDSPPCCMGIFQQNGQTILVMDARTVLGMPSLGQEVGNFSSMKDKHIRWIQELGRSVRENTPFTLPMDPRKCAFGEWYYNFDTDNGSIKLLLKKIEGPHAAMHRCAAEIAQYVKNGEPDKVTAKLEQAELICQGTVIPLLDQLIAAYHEAAKGIVLVSHYQGGEGSIGLYVDEITALLTAQDVNEGLRNKAAIHSFAGRHFIRDVIWGADSKIYLEIDLPFLLRQLDLGGCLV